MSSTLENPIPESPPAASVASSGYLRKLLASVRADLACSDMDFLRLLDMSHDEATTVLGNPDPVVLFQNSRFGDIVNLVTALRDTSDPASIRVWMHQPDDHYNGATPMEVIQRGEIQEIARRLFGCAL